MRVKQFLFVLYILVGLTTFMDATPEKIQLPEPQPNKEMIVGLYSFLVERDVKGLYPTIIAGHISEKLSCFEDISVMQANTFPTVKEVIEDGMSIESALAETVAQGERANANKLVMGHIARVEELYDYRNSTLQISIIMDVAIIDVKTAKVEKAKQLIFQGRNTYGIGIKIALRKAGIDPSLVTVNDVLSLMGEKGLVKAIEKSLKEMNNDLFPMLSSHFGDYDPQCVVPDDKKGPKIKLPVFGKKGGKNKDEVAEEEVIYNVVNLNSENSLLITTNGEEKWKKRFTKFDIIEKVEETTLLDSDKIIIREVKIGEAKFNSYSGEYAIIEIGKKSKNKASEVVEGIKNKRNIYIKRKDKKQSEN